MSQNKDKKRRRVIRKLYEEQLKVVSEINARIIKPRPRFIPYPVWRFLIGFFIVIKKDGTS
jgi:hypothetical protein